MGPWEKQQQLSCLSKRVLKGSLESFSDSFTGMWAATAWDDSDWDGHRARGWTVMEQLRKHRDRRLEETRAAQLRLDERAGSLQLMSAAATVSAAADEAAARWTGGPSVLALLFAHPDAEVIATLDTRGEYFDHRTGDTWDLFFPGYYRAPDPVAERRYGALPVGKEFLEDWYFHPRDFNLFRREIEQLSGESWRYSGTTDLVLASAWLTSNAEPTVDWATTASGSLTDVLTGTVSVSLPEVIERLSREIEKRLQSLDYGLPELTEQGGESIPPAARDAMSNALGGIIAALGMKALGG